MLACMPTRGVLRGPDNGATTLFCCRQEDIFTSVRLFRGRQVGTMLLFVTLDLF